MLGVVRVQELVERHDPVVYVAYSVYDTFAVIGDGQIS